jgi:hypothetical protein
MFKVGDRVTPKRDSLTKEMDSHFGGKVGTVMMITPVKYPAKYGGAANHVRIWIKDELGSIQLQFLDTELDLVE